MFDLKKRPSPRIIAMLMLSVVLCILGGWFWFNATREPKLLVTYIRAIDGHGHWSLQFGITNTGNSTVFTSTFGRVEVAGHTNLLSVGATAALDRLSPGEGQVVDAVLSDSDMEAIDGKWRYTCLYAPGGLRSRIYHWQWGTNGPGARVNWLIPRGLKGLRLTVKGTSDWIAPPQAMSTKVAKSTVERSGETNMSQPYGADVVSGQSKPARDGRMKTSHFESGIAHRAAKAAEVRDEPTQRESATNHCYFGLPWLVAASDRPPAGH